MQIPDKGRGGTKGIGRGLNRKTGAEEAERSWLSVGIDFFPERAKREGKAGVKEEASAITGRVDTLVEGVEKRLEVGAFVVAVVAVAGANEKDPAVFVRDVGVEKRPVPDVLPPCAVAVAGGKEKSPEEEVPGVCPVVACWGCEAEEKRKEEDDDDDGGAAADVEGAKREPAPEAAGVEKRDGAAVAGGPEKENPLKAEGGAGVCAC